MHKYWHVLLESVVDVAKMLPILFVVYYLIELLEFKYAIKFQNNKLLKGKASPVVGTLIGCVPQCGFSVVSTDLFSKGAVSVGALIGVYIATSDEALPLMVANPKYIPWLIALIAIKIVFGICVGYLSIWLYSLIFKEKNKPLNLMQQEEFIEQTKHVEHDDHDEDEMETEELNPGCCHHHVRTKSFEWLHPLLHCLKISVFILGFNILLNCITHIWIGEKTLLNFLNKSYWIQPLVAVIVGLIPNCASSVALAELFMMSSSGGLSFGALCAGLCVNAGLGLVILIKQNKNWKQNMFIISVLVFTSLILGYLISFIELLF